MFKLLKDLFNIRPATGAIESPVDTRNIALASFQEHIDIPGKYKSFMTAVRNQGSKPKCVGDAIAEIAEMYFKRKGIIVNLSGDDIYEQAKKIDGIPNVPGTYPSLGANIAHNRGISTIEAYNSGDKKNVEESRKNYRLGGYAFVGHSFESVCQAIYQNGAIVASLDVDKNWYNGIIQKVLKSTGRHLVVFHGYDEGAKLIIGQNSWGINWVGRIAGLLNKQVEPGHFNLHWDDYKDNLADLIVFADIPKELLEDTKAKEFYFSKTLRYGSRGYEVKKLQDRLRIKSDGIFGPNTKRFVYKYQSENGLLSDGIVGPNTRKKLNGGSNLIDAIIKVESNGDDNAIGDKDLKDKAYGPMQIRQPAVTDVNIKAGTNHKAEDMLGNRSLSIWLFKEYMDMYAKDKSDQDKARIWNGGPTGHKRATTIGYWNKVRKHL